MAEKNYNFSIRYPNGKVVVVDDKYNILENAFKLNPNDTINYNNQYFDFQNRKVIPAKGEINPQNIGELIIKPKKSARYKFTVSYQGNIVRIVDDTAGILENAYITNPNSTIKYDNQFFDFQNLKVIPAKGVISPQNIGKLIIEDLRPPPTPASPPPPPPTLSLTMTVAPPPPLPLQPSPVGFRNFGNTCYLNSLLQCLLSSTVLLNSSCYTEGGNQFFQLLSNLRAAPTSNYAEIFVRQIVEYLQKQYPLEPINTQCDSAIYFKDKLFPLFSKNCQKLFESDIVMQHVCVDEATRDEKTKRWNFVNKMVVNSERLTAPMLRIPPPKEPNQTLLTMLNFPTLYLPMPQVCTLTGSRKDTRQFTFRQVANFAPILFVTYTSRLNYRNGEFEIKLDDFKTSTGKSYKLIGIIYHIGDATGGHYIAFVRRLNQWYEANDRVITPLMSPTQLSSLSPYIVKTPFVYMYERAV